MPYMRRRESAFDSDLLLPPIANPTAEGVLFDCIRFGEFFQSRKPER